MCLRREHLKKKSKLSVKSVETEGKRHYGRELSEKAHWQWTYIKIFKKSYSSEIQHHQNSNIRRVFSYFLAFFQSGLSCRFVKDSVTFVPPWRVRQSDGVPPLESEVKNCDTESLSKVPRCTSEKKDFWNMKKPDSNESRKHGSYVFIETRWNQR